MFLAADRVEESRVHQGQTEHGADTDIFWEE